MKENILAAFLVATFDVINVLFTSGVISSAAYAAWTQVLHPVLGLPELSFSQIFICAIAFMTAIVFGSECCNAIAFGLTVEETKEVKEDDEDGKKKD